MVAFILPKNIVFGAATLRFSQIRKNNLIKERLCLQCLQALLEKIIKIISKKPVLLTLFF